MNLTLDYLKEEDRVFYFESTNSNYSLAGVEIQLRRHKAKYILQYYCTSGLFVVVSWVSFLVPPEIIPGRMAMLITLFLVLTNIFNVSVINISKSFYIKLIMEEKDG